MLKRWWRQAGTAWVGAVTGLVLGAAILGPALRPGGYLLHYDLVFVPDPGFGARTLGVDGSVPRAVPGDLLTALIGLALPGWLTEQLILLGVFVIVGSGVGALARSKLGAVVATTVACWNPYVAERLGIGHWAFLLGYALVPWTVVAFGALRERKPGSVLGAVTVLVAGAWTGGTGAVMVTGVALGVVFWGRARKVGDLGKDLALVAGIALLANAAWWWPYVALAQNLGSDVSGVGAFATRSDGSTTVVGAVLTGGGIWNEAVWMPERGSLLSALWPLLVVLGVVSWWFWTRQWTRRVGLAGLATAAVGSVVLALAPVFVPDVLRWSIEHIPGAGLLRDAQKFLGIWMAFVAVACGAGAESFRHKMRSGGADVKTSNAIAMALGVWALIALPTLAFGRWGVWQAVNYPPSSMVMVEKIDALPAGSMAVFPWNQYRRYAWNDDKVLLDPWPRLVSRQVVTNDALFLFDGRVVAGEDTAVARITEALGRPDLADLLRAEGVRYVLIEADQPGIGNDEHALAMSGRVVATQSGLMLIDLGEPVTSRPAPPWWAYLGLAALGSVSATLVVLWLTKASYFLYDRRHHTIGKR